MGSIYRPSDSGSDSTEATTFIQCVDGLEPLIRELWCLGLDGISREVHPTELVDVTAGTVGEFVTNYLSEVGFRLFATCWLALRPQGGEVGTIPIRTR